MKDKGAGRSWVYCFSTDHVSNNDSWTFLFLSPGKCQNHSDDYIASSWKRMSAYLLNFFSGVQLLIFSPGSHVLYTYCLLRHSFNRNSMVPTTGKYYTHFPYKNTNNYSHQTVCHWERHSTNPAEQAMISTWLPLHVPRTPVSQECDFSQKFNTWWN